MFFKRKKIALAVSLALGLPHQSAFAQFDPSFELSDINGQNGLTINGVAIGDGSGTSVSTAGDINGDGIDDIIIGALTAGIGGNYSGSSYVVYGTANGLSNPFNLEDINGLNGFAINGAAAGDFSGRSVSSAGDFNGDGNDDLIIGANNASSNGNSGAGASYLIFGTDTGLPNPLSLDNLNGTNGIVINGAATNDSAGTSVSSAGDINDDGFDDLIIGAPFADPSNNDLAGSSYVVFGAASGIPNPLNLADINGLNGFTINGAAASDQSGTSVSAAGDINGDGIDDLVIGAKLASSNGNDAAGSSYVVFGTTSGFPNPLKLEDINGTNGFVINGVAFSDQSGTSVSAAGDINGDGTDDLIVGAYTANSTGGNDTGSSYVVFGSTNQFSNPFNLSNLDGFDGFTINGVAENDLSGISVNEAGDFNSDGISDVIIGARAAAPNGNSGAGSSYVVFGKEKPIFKDDFE